MERRLRGVLVLLLAGVLLLTVAVLNAPGVAGRAAAMPPDGPPAVGNCLLRNEYRGSKFIAPTDINGILMSGTGRFGSCAEEHQGEVMAVFDGGSSVDVAERCSGDAVSGYLGAAADELFPYAPWKPQLNFVINAAIPDQRQLAVGQDWLACVVEPVGGGLYAGSIRHGFGTGEVPGVYSTCTDHVPGKLPSNGRCDQPHSTENLAHQRIVGPGPEPAELLASCREIAQYRLGLADPSVGGELSVQVLVYLQDAPLRLIEEPVPVGETGQAFCQISSAGSRQLAASLLGLGEGDIPWA